MTETQYDGFRKLATRIVSEWLGRQSNGYWEKQAHRTWLDARAFRRAKKGFWCPDDAAIRNLRRHLEEEIVDSLPLTMATLYSELLKAALSTVDWYALAECFITDVSEAMWVSGDLEDDFCAPTEPGPDRDEAIKDGALIDVSEMARDVGIAVPTAVSASVWEHFIMVTDAVDGQNEKDRLWNVLNMFYCTARRDLKCDVALFDVLVKTHDTAPRPLTLKAICCQDSPEPVLTIMLPVEN